MARLSVLAQIDSFMNGSSPDTNYGVSGSIEQGPQYIGADKTSFDRAIMNFDVSAIAAGSVIAEARLERYVAFVAVGGAPIKIARCTRPATWTEGGVTWNKYDGVNAWTAAGGDFDDVTPARVTFVEALAVGAHVITGLGAFVRDALDLRSGIVSLVLRNEDEAPLESERSIWYSRTQTIEALKTFLVVDYDVVGDAGRRDGGAGGVQAGPSLEGRGVGPARGARGVEGVGGVRPRGPLALVPSTGSGPCLEVCR